MLIRSGDEQLIITKDSLEGWLLGYTWNYLDDYETYLFERVTDKKIEEEYKNRSYSSAKKRRDDYIKTMSEDWLKEGNKNNWLDIKDKLELLEELVPSAQYISFEEYKAMTDLLSVDMFIRNTISDQGGSGDTLLPFYYICITEDEILTESSQGIWLGEYLTNEYEKAVEEAEDASTVYMYKDVIEHRYWLARQRA
jgi:hypothetical protein